MHTPYSGMLPGYVAGHYGYDDVHIDLSPARRVCRRAVLSRRGDRAGPGDKKVLCPNRPPVPYDLLSINIGSTPQMRQVPGAAENAVRGKADSAFQRALAGAARSGARSCRAR